MEKHQGYVYTLQLESGRYYVGWSQDIQTRIASHWLGVGAKWTQLYKPVEIVDVKEGGTLLETLTTIALMCEKGYANVRGGSYCHVEMTKPPACITKALHYATYRKDAEIEDINSRPAL